MLKAIETRYNGYRFRSRLEARWAVFFDTLGVRYEYEPEGFDLDGLWYLPDFWLPEQRTWIEVKPETPGGEDLEKIQRFANVLRGLPATEDRLALPDDTAEPPQFVVLVGGPGLSHSNGGDVPDSHEQYSPYWDNYMEWTCCPGCGMVGIRFSGRGDYLGCSCPESTNRKAGYDHPRILRAYEMARSARFDGR